jgi:hypothetical protein
MAAECCRALGCCGARTRLHQVATQQDLTHRYFRRRCAVSQTEQNKGNEIMESSEIGT